MTDQPASQTPRTAVIGAVALIEHSVEHDLLDEYLHWVLRHALGHDRCVPAQHCDRCGIRMCATPDKDVDNLVVRAERAEAERDQLRKVVTAAAALIDAWDLTGSEHLWEDYADACLGAGITLGEEDEA